MTTTKSGEVEFTNVRSNYYKEAHQEYPNARDEERAMALKQLAPQTGEHILEVGAGGGFFSTAIAECLGASGQLVVSDPSLHQLESLQLKAYDNIQVLLGGAEALPKDSPLLINSSFDAVWSGGSFHHCPNKTAALKTFCSVLKTGGRLVIADVFAGSTLARHFDLEVAKYCTTGHEVAFLTKEFADSLCYTCGFEVPTFDDVVIHWQFPTKEGLKMFLYKIHAMTATSPENCLSRAEEILGVTEENGRWLLNWPLTVMKTQKI